METNLSMTIDYTRDSARYDASVKEMLADKQVLSRILKYTLDEFTEYSIEEIVACIGEPEVGNIIINPGLTNVEKVVSLNSEDSIVGEGKIFFDIRFIAYSPKGKIKIIINIEAQKSSKYEKLHYQLDNRIIYYLARLISSQKGVEFTNSNYDDIKSVKSIWICMDTEDDNDSINRFSFKQDTIYGKEMALPNLDKVQGIIIRIRENENAEASKNKLIAMLEELLKKEDVTTKKEKLIHNYDMVMNVETERKVNSMCNLSEVMIEKGYKEGIEFEIYSSVYEGDYSMERGAEKLSCSIEQFKTRYEAWLVQKEGTM